jgi:hypothetical protein
MIMAIVMGAAFIKSSATWRKKHSATAAFRVTLERWLKKRQE